MRIGAPGGQALNPAPQHPAPHEQGVSTPPVADPLTGRQVVVLGLMGAGKTTLASRLAAAWGRPLRDSDLDLRERTGSTAAQIAEREGKAALHRLEAEHLLESLAGPACIVAAAASTVEQPDCRAALVAPYVIWLEADPRRLAARQGTGSHRPRYEQDLEHMLIEMDRRRRPVFEEIADAVVHLGGVRIEPDEARRERQKQALADAVAAAIVAGEPGVRVEIDADGVLDSVP